MAYIADTLHPDAGLAERTTSALSRWFWAATETLARRRIASVTYTELAQLSDRELTDLGLVRADLRHIAREAAQGKF